MTRFFKIFFLFLIAFTSSSFAENSALHLINCPQADLPSSTRCYSGQDQNGAWFLIAIPRNWNHTLVLHSHGGPSLDVPHVNSSNADLKRFSVVVKEGYAWAGSSYRHAGFGVRDAAEDTENLRKIFWKTFGRPQYTFLHGQSWGANIAVKTAEIYNQQQNEKFNYDALLLTNGVLGGGTRSYNFRADLRAVYQYYCHNHPAPGEPEYPLWQGLNTNNTMTSAELEKRINNCTGINFPIDQRTAEQKQNLRNILSVIRIPEKSLMGHMSWATFTFHDLVMRQLSGKNPFDNEKVIYSGSDDDVVLNKNIIRFVADPKAVEELSDDANFSGELSVPVITIHAINDPTAFVELENAFYQTVLAAGMEKNILQIFTDEDNHQKLSNAEYASIFSAMYSWINKGQKPNVALVAKTCETKNTSYKEGCNIVEDYYPPELKTRVPDRFPIQ